MATSLKTKATQASDRQNRARANAAAPPTGALDAIDLLKADHLEVSHWFAAYEDATDDGEKTKLARKICLALKVHTQIEEEIFYPAVRKATHDNDLIDEAVVEQACAKTLIAEIEAMKVGDNLYDAKIKVLGEQIKHHVNEEETELFPEARATKLDLNDLGRKLAARKVELSKSMSSKKAA